MGNASFRRSHLLALLPAVAALAVAGAAHGQAPAPKPPAKTAAPPSALSPYATTVSPAKAAASLGYGSDPFEAVNRKIFLFNGALDIILIRPLAVFWHHAAPKPLRQAINNFLSNLGEPVVFINDVLQGHPATAAGTATRFAVNTTVGIGGILDVTGSTGLPHHDNGFGLTLGRWGVKSGPYLMLPVLGPSTVRDGIGQGIDTAANPLTYARNTGSGGMTTGLGVIGGLDARAESDADLKALQAMSTDVYAALRSFYLQNREAQVTGGKIDLDALPNFDDPGEGSAPAKAPTPAAAATPAKGAAAAIDATPSSAPAASATSAATGSEITAGNGAVADSVAQTTPETASAPQGGEAAAPPTAAPKGV